MANLNYPLTRSEFYYARYAEPEEDHAYEGVNYDQKIFFHRVGTPQSEDILVYERPDQKEWGFSAEVSDGGFNIPLTPLFSISRLIWLDMGGILAWACLRGGGKFGANWHKSGMIDNKQKVFDDFIACAEHLIAEGMTSPQRLAIQGRSNGGLLNSPQPFKRLRLGRTRF